MPKTKGTVALPLEKEEIIKDYRLAYQSRQASLIGRREVLSGKAKFGIFGDGKELANIAVARAFQKGDWRSGYYRDQTWMFMLGVMNVQEFFAQLYAHTDIQADPASAGPPGRCSAPAATTRSPTWSSAPPTGPSWWWGRCGRPRTRTPGTGGSAAAGTSAS